MNSQPSYFAFEGDHCIASGNLAAVARAAKQVLDHRPDASVLVFDAISGPVELDFRGSADDVVARLAASENAAPPAARGPGRPKLGVVAREVTLLPRHWDWLAQQPGGASVALRRLVEEARRANRGRDQIRQAQETAYRFIAAMGENKPHYEEVARSLFTRDAAGFEKWTTNWPADVRDHARRLAAASFDHPSTQASAD